MTAAAYRVQLTPEERVHLRHIVQPSTVSVFTHRRAAILLAADHQPDRAVSTAAPIAAIVDVSPRTVARGRARWAAAGVAATITPRPRGTKGRTRFDTATQARIAQVACRAPPPGHARWRLRRLADELVVLAIVPHLCPETVRTTLKKTTVSHG